MSFMPPFPTPDPLDTQAMLLGVLPPQSAMPAVKPLPGMFGMSPDTSDAVASSLLGALQSMPAINPRIGQGEQFAQAFLRSALGAIAAPRVANIQSRAEDSRRVNEANLRASEEYRRQIGDAARSLREHRYRLAEQAAREKPPADPEKEAYGRTLGTLRAEKEMGAGDFAPPKPSALSGLGGIYGEVDPQAIAEAIYTGRQSPLMITQIGRPAVAAVASILQKKYGFDLQRAQIDAQAAASLYRTLNTGLQQRLRQATFNAGHQTDLVEQSAADVERLMPRLPAEFANKGLGWIARNGGLGPEASSAVTNLRAQISVLQSELSNVFQGGGVPTDESKKMAQHVINADMSPANLRASIYTVRREIANRLRSFEEAGVASPSNPPGQPQGATFKIGPLSIETKPPAVPDGYEIRDGIRVRVRR